MSHEEIEVKYEYKYKYYTIMHAYIHALEVLWGRNTGSTVYKHGCIGIEVYVHTVCK